MSEAHTADLGTRYRYRQEGAEAERERIIQLLKDTDSVMGDWAIALIKGEQDD
jgi:hypothetical protein